jgi:thiamine phosphate synthase YjbQ (UPF0047 family)
MNFPESLTWVSGIYASGDRLPCFLTLRSMKLPEMGLLNLFIKYTSAGLIINENADSSVLSDFKTFFSDGIPESYPKFGHDYLVF